MGYREDAEDFDSSRNILALRQAEREEAEKAVRNAMADFRNQPWYWTAYANIRFALYWCTYWLRLQLAIFGVMRLGWDDKRTWLRLGL